MTRRGPQNPAKPQQHCVDGLEFASSMRMSNSFPESRKAAWGQGLGACANLPQHWMTQIPRLQAHSHAGLRPSAHRIEVEVEDATGGKGGSILESEGRDTPRYPRFYFSPKPQRPPGVQLDQVPTTNRGKQP